MEPILWALTPFSSASSFPDELSWIMELLEKDSLALQEPLGEQGPFGESPSSILPQPDGPQLGEPGPPLTTHLCPSDQGSPFTQEMLEDCRQASPPYTGGFGAGAPSPGSSDASTAGEPSLGRLPAAALLDALSPGLCPPPTPRLSERMAPGWAVLGLLGAHSGPPPRDWRVSEPPCLRLRWK